MLTNDVLAILKFIYLVALINIFKFSTPMNPLKLINPHHIVAASFSLTIIEERMRSEKEVVSVMTLSKNLVVEGI